LKNLKKEKKTINTIALRNDLYNGGVVFVFLGHSATRLQKHFFIDCAYIASKMFGIAPNVIT